MKIEDKTISGKQIVTYIKSRIAELDKSYVIGDYSYNDNELLARNSIKTLEQLAEDLLGEKWRDE